MRKRKVSKNAKELSGTRVKLSFRKHFLPPIGGLLVAFLVFGFFNSELLSGKIAYQLYSRNVSVANLDNQLTAATAIDKNAPPKLLINKIGVTAPIIFDQKTVDQAAFQKALQHGIVHYPNTALPGQQGNVVVFGHSSGQWWAPGDYKFVFTLLGKVKYDDKIFLEYNGTRYIYRISNISVVKPDDLSALNQGSNNILTLITCTPVGTSSKRLVIQAIQIVPKPADTTNFNKPATLPAEAEGKLPGSPASFWHNLQDLLH